MSRIDDLLRQFVANYETGGGDPRPYISQVEGQDRDQLIELIDEYLAEVPGDRWDEAAFKGSAAESMVEPLAKALTGRSGTWPSLLPELRHQARIKRSDLVARLADSLGVRGSEERVAVYYNGMEQGTVDSAGVSSRVLDALGEILHAKGAALRDAGRAITGTDFKGQQPTFARVSPGPAIFSTEDMGEPDRPVKGMSSPAESPMPNKKTDMLVDELFTGGA